MYNHQRTLWDKMSQGTTTVPLRTFPNRCNTTLNSGIPHTSATTRFCFTCQMVIFWWGMWWWCLSIYTGPFSSVRTPHDALLQESFWNSLSLNTVLLPHSVTHLYNVGKWWLETHGYDNFEFQIRSVRPEIDVSIVSHLLRSESKTTMLFMPCV